MSKYSHYFIVSALFSLFLGCCASNLGKKQREDIIFVIDVSSSMITQDFAPSRLEVAKTAVSSLLSQKEEEQYMGIILLAGKSMILSPLTKNIDSLKSALDLVAHNKIPDGTMIGDGIFLALWELSKSKAKTKNIIFINDGERNNLDDRYRIDSILNVCQSQDVLIHAVSFGTFGKVRAPLAQNARKEYIYGFTESKTEPSYWQYIATYTRGNFVHIKNPSELNNLPTLAQLLVPTSLAAEVLPASWIPPTDLQNIWAELQLKNDSLQQKFHSKESKE